MCLLTVFYYFQCVSVYAVVILALVRLVGWNEPNVHNGVVKWLGKDNKTVGAKKEEGKKKAEKTQ